MRTIWLFLGMIAMYGCAHPHASPTARSSAQEPTVATASSNASAPPVTPHAIYPFDRGASMRALNSAGYEIEKCGGGAPDSMGRGHAQITFEPTGHISDVSIDPPFDTSSVADCITSALRRIAIPEFLGGPIVIGKSFQIGADAVMMDPSEEKTLKQALFAIDFTSCNPADEEQPGIKHAYVVFAPDGSVSNVRVMGTFANGEAGECIATKIRSTLRATPGGRSVRWINAPLKLPSAPFARPANP